MQSSLWKDYPGERTHSLLGDGYMNHGCLLWVAADFGVIVQIAICAVCMYRASKWLQI